MDLTFIDKMDLLLCICFKLEREKERYSFIEHMSEEEIEEFIKDYEITTDIDKTKIEGNIERLETLRDKFKKETN